MTKLKSCYRDSRKWILLFVVGAMLGACATPPQQPIQTTFAGPKFAASEFVCPPKPMPPDRAHRGARDGNKYIGRLAKRGDDCQNQLSSVGGQLDAAGQVVK